jgi:Xaa-Pro aminopeptidase
MRNRTDVAYVSGGPYDGAIGRALSTARGHGERMGVVTPKRTIDPRAVLHEMRVIKTDDEIAALRQACHISAVAHVEAMRFTQPGRTERQVQAALEYVFGVMDAERVGYGSIVAGGDNAVILHYVENDQVLSDGDLLLIDAGAEYRHLTADITRTFPVNGTFSGPQRAIYDIVLEAEQAVIASCSPGLPYTAMHTQAIEILTAGMVELGDIERRICPVVRNGACGPGPEPVPRLHLGVPWAHEEDVLLGGVGGIEHSYCVGLGEAGEEEEVGALPELVGDVVVARLLDLCCHDGERVTHALEERRPTDGESIVGHAVIVPAVDSVDGQSNPNPIPSSAARRLAYRRLTAPRATGSDQARDAPTLRP